MNPTNTACLACHGTNHSFFTEKNGCQLYRCKRCGLIFIDPLPKNTEAIYSINYFKGASHGFGYPDYEEEKKESAKTFIKIMRKIEHFLSKGTLLDIGAASGLFLERARERGWHVTGVEISEYALEEAKKKGLPMYKTMGNIKNTGRQFNIITFLDTIEHMDNPLQMIQEALKVLAPGGYFVFNTPNAGSFFAKTMGKQWHLIVPPEHIYLFNPRNFEHILSQVGLTSVSRASIGKKFTLTYIADLLKNGHQSSRLLAKLSRFLSKSKLGKISIPINLHDNMFLIVKRKTEV